jgi:hypothetical protein
MRLLINIAILAILNTPAFAWSNSYCKHIEGSSVFGQDEKKTFLGIIEVQSKPNSIFNKNNPYGNELSETSIWNKNSIYGNETSPYSSLNPFAIAPPIIIKNEKPLGHISKNLHQTNAITGFYLRIICRQFLKK